MEPFFLKKIEQLEVFKNVFFNFAGSYCIFAYPLHGGGGRGAFPYWAILLRCIHNWKIFGTKLESTVRILELVLSKG